MTTIRLADRWITELVIEIPRHPIITLDRKYRGALPERVWQAFDRMALDRGHNSSMAFDVTADELAAIIDADVKLKAAARVSRVTSGYSGGKW